MIINTISVLALIFGIMTITRIETKKKVNMEKLAIVGKLAARVAHDMRNPLSIIQMTLENIKMLHKIDEKEQKQFDKIESAIFRITHQIDDVLDFVKTPVIKKKYYSLNSILEDSIKKINIKSNIKVKLPQNDCKILCDRNKMLIVFVNIIYNAVQDLKNIGIIRISFDLDVNWITIKIEDNGNGIESKMLSKIFDPLITTRQTGTGLGLSSCKSIVESHNGVISACNGPERGAIFSIRIPS
jgi:signal transduction histidine kinase